jgi:hypothetical protein
MSGSAVDIKPLYQEDGTRQQSDDECNCVFVDRCVKYLKLADKTNERDELG